MKKKIEEGNVIRQVYQPKTEERPECNPKAQSPDVEEAIQMCLKEAIKAIERGDNETAAKLLVQPMKAFPNYSKLDPRKLVVLEPLKSEDYPKDWHHVTLHISSDGSIIHSDEAQPDGDGSGKFGPIIRKALKNSEEFIGLFDERKD